LEGLRFHERFLFLVDFHGHVAGNAIPNTISGHTRQQVFKKNLLYTQGRNEGGKRPPPGAESRWGGQITAGSAEKSQQCYKYIFFYSIHLLP